MDFESTYANSNLRWKNELLVAAKASGLWLLDASCHACAMGRKVRLPDDLVKKDSADFVENLC